MAAGDSQATLESLINRATDPINQEDRWDCIQGFYQLVNQETDGAQVAIRLLAHKILSPQEKVALQALTVLEACMNNCGKRFHSEAAKFRFLNELIKVLSPKYNGPWTPQKVKERVTEVLYGWTLWLKDEPKIQEAYCMLKKQGIVKKDPKLPDTMIMAPPPQRTTQSVFDQEDKAKLLARLLRSGRPEDLETANRLIKNTIREEQEKAVKVSKRESILKDVESSTKDLRDLLEQHTITGIPKELSDDAKMLYERCDRLRPTLFRLASDTVEDDAVLAQILSANDELTLVVNAYKERMGIKECNGGRERSQSEEEMDGKNNAPRGPREIKSYHLINLSAVVSPQMHRRADSPPPFQTFSPMFSCFPENDQDLNELDLDNLVTKPTRKTSKSYYEDLLQLNGEDWMENGQRKNVLRGRGCGECSTTSNETKSCQTFTDSSPSKVQKQLSKVFRSPVKSDGSCPSQTLSTIFVPMETIKFSHLEPITLFDQVGIRACLHFAKDSPQGHPGVAVVIISTMNTSALHVRDFLFQVAVPKTMQANLQPASGTCLPPYNPLLPPPAISQVILLANPQKRKFRLRYKLSMTHGDQHLNEIREIDSFPDWSTLTGLDCE